MKWIQLVIISMGLTLQAIAQDFESVDLKVSPVINGTLIRPANKEAVPLVILIQGSGPTDRNGNQPMVKNNALKLLAEGLQASNIASFRFDKRIVEMAKTRTLDESTLTFDQFVGDALDVFNYFKASNAFSQYYILGHSQGSLIGMLVAQQGADGFISIAGPGQTIDALIIDQLERQAPGLADNAKQAFDDLRKTGEAKNFSPGLASIFRPSVQPFIKSWMQYDPQAEIAKLNIPVLILNGDKDLQTDPNEAKLLQQTKADAVLQIIPNMNHILKEISGNDLENSKSYNDPSLPLHPELIPTLVNFINQ